VSPPDPNPKINTLVFANGKSWIVGLDQIRLVPWGCAEEEVCSHGAYAEENHSSEGQVGLVSEYGIALIGKEADIEEDGCGEECE
jgi:hypothetical protein